MTTFLANGFRDVDGVSETGKIVRCLAFLDDLPDVRAYKERSIDALRLRAHSRAADLACSLGFDLLRLHRRAGEGHVVGFDRSHDLVAAARLQLAGQAGVEVRLADVHHINHADGDFDAVRIDRSLQHVADPPQVVREMARLTRTGGFVSAAEPDWRTFSITTAGSPVGQRLSAAWIASFRNPFIGASLVDLLADAGLDICDHFVQPVLLTHFEAADRVFDVRENAGRCVGSGIVNEVEAAETLQTMAARSDAGRFYARLCIHAVTARKR